MPYFDEGEPLQVGGYSALEGDMGDSLSGPLGFHTPVGSQEPFCGDEQVFGSPSVGSFPTRPYSVSYDVGSL